MKILLPILTLLLLPVAAAAEVFYLNEGDSLPAGRVCAVEARCRHHGARTGRQASWTIQWEGGEVTIDFDCRNLVDGIGEPEVTVTCGGKTAPATGVNFNGGWNSLAVEWYTDGTAIVLAGDNNLTQTLTLGSLPRPRGTLCVTSSPGKFEVMDLIAETDDADLSRLMTDADTEALEPWVYLDRSGDSARSLPGGTYSLGLLPSAEGYDIIYLGGAGVNSAAWRPGMRKGRLTSRGFDGHYLLRWIDATGRDLPGEHYALLDRALRILTLKFPALDATLRFAPVK